MRRFLTREEQAKVKNGEALGLTFAKTKMPKANKDKPKIKGKKPKKKKRWISVVSVPFGGMRRR